MNDSPIYVDMLWVTSLARMWAALAEIFEQEAGL